MNIYSSIKRPRRSELPPSGERVVLGNLPMFHAYGMSAYVTELLNPLSKVVLIPRFVEEEFLNIIQVSNSFNSSKSDFFKHKNDLPSISDIQSDDIVFGSTNNCASGQVTIG